ncbi:type I-F CRISPR-associated endoribonuclease Cas6/Csy4 [Seleniivibrio woodruffii]|uniref:CRISPR-associated Csy4 family protein n=1 Tax=Seleniivibrio woodruffii TaxID=1078050 RepID=A0A4R1K9A8_9BACT|nr:type I-F CRISPR-associated endoribonuclease Cas6/Csy4 [Seleniivibrio woodruffii]TCK60433.1 CRISPR-associated Csy4 family protein [Seleniivibrio woodruffii]TVZ36061.1 CRISPR-associated endonuclease Csy4 [Seleniivibrio woodruffii]
MQYYTDIKIQPNPEIAPQVVLNMLYEKLHLVLAEQKRNDVGISFPEADKNLGTVLRLHGELDPLQDVLEHRFVKVMQDYALVGRIKKIPEKTGYLLVSRVQAKSSPERLRRRSMKCLGLTEEQAKEKIPDSKAKFLDLPFIILNSRSTGQKFRLFIRQSEQTAGTAGEFSTYGLSTKATVPKF